MKQCGLYSGIPLLHTINSVYMLPRLAVSPSDIVFDNLVGEGNS